MKPYLLFAGRAYYPRGGWGDYVDSADSIEEALDLIPSGVDWYHIVHNEQQIVEGTV